MKTRSLSKISLTVFIGILLFIFLIWFIPEKSDSYSEPQEALLAFDNELVLIPGYKINGNALFFFIKDKNNLGATFVKEGIFGWKTGMLTWSSIGNKRNYEKLSGYMGHGDHLLYGLIKNGDDRIIKMDGTEAIILNLGIMLDPSVVKEHQLEDLNIWYFESDTGFDGKEIKLINKDTEEEINTILVGSTN